MPPRYKPRHPELYTLRDEHLAPSVVRAVRDGAPEALRAVLTEELPGVYSLELFAPAYCEKLLEEVHRYEHWCAHHGVAVERPNSMNRYGVVLDDMGMEDALDELMLAYVAPFAALLYPEHGGATLDHHHGFLVEYAPGGDVDLDFHADDSEVTLNACVGRAFDGGALYFGGVRCATHRGTAIGDGELGEVAHVVGRAVLHAGAHRHGARAIASGHRANVIVWCRSSRLRRRAQANPADDAHPAWCRAA